MPSETRSGLRTVLLLTLYVGWLPLIGVYAVMLLARELGATDESLGWVFAALYFVAVYFGGHAVADRLETQSTTSEGRSQNS